MNLPNPYTVASPVTAQFRQQQFCRHKSTFEQICQLYNSNYAPKNQLFILLALCSTISIPPDAQLRRPSGGVWGDLAKIRLTSSLSFLFGPPLWRVLGSLIIALNKFCGWLDIAQDACNCNLYLWWDYFINGKINFETCKIWTLKLYLLYL